MGERRAGQFDTLVDREQARRLGRVVHHRHDDRAEQFERLLDHVDVTEVDRIETPG